MGAKTKEEQVTFDEIQSDQEGTEAAVGEGTDAVVAEATESEDAAQAEEGATDAVTSQPEPADVEPADEESEDS